MPLAFEKWEGLGNDFVVLRGGSGLDRARAVALCDRHRGIGADGVLEVGVEGGRISMRVVNADGSEPEMCGNGLRCVARYAFAAGLATTGRFVVETASGPHGCEILDGDLVRVEMRAPSLAPADVPVRAAHPMIDAPVEVGARTLHLTAVSMGNPHAVTFDALEPGERRALGPALEGLVALFPARVNAGFARVVPDGERTIELHVFERGAGWTEACGTGACAAAAAAVETGRLSRSDGPIRVRLPGGDLSIDLGAPGQRAWMTGPARRVFVGTA